MKAETCSLGLAEAFISAGARTVLQKLWYDDESSLADTVSLGNALYRTSAALSNEVLQHLQEYGTVAFVTQG